MSSRTPEIWKSEWPISKLFSTQTALKIKNALAKLGDARERYRRARKLRLKCTWREPRRGKYFFSSPLHFQQRKSLGNCARNDRHVHTRVNPWSGREIKKWTNRRRRPFFFYRHIVPQIPRVNSEWNQYRGRDIVGRAWTEWNFRNIIPVSKHCNFLLCETNLSAAQLFPTDPVFPNSLVAKGI